MAHKQVDRGPSRVTGGATQMYRLIAAWFGQAGLNPRPLMKLNYPVVLKSLVAAGQGVAVLPLEHPDNAGRVRACKCDR